MKNGFYLSRFGPIYNRQLTIRWYACVLFARKRKASLDLTVRSNKCFVEVKGIKKRRLVKVSEFVRIKKKKKRRIVEFFSDGMAGDTKHSSFVCVKSINVINLQTTPSPLYLLSPLCFTFTFPLALLLPRDTFPTYRNVS